MIEIPTPRSLEEMSEEAWRALKALDAMVEGWPPVFEKTALDLRSFRAYLRAAQELRTSPVETQVAAATALFAALREVSASVLSLGEILSKFNLALTPTAGEN